LVEATFSRNERGSVMNKRVIVRAIDIGGVSIRKYDDQFSSGSEKNASKNTWISRAPRRPRVANP
jgi:hypothetical protein